MANEWKKIAQIEDIPLGSAKAIQLETECIALFHTEEGYFAVSEMCPHRGGPLSEGKVSHGQVRCPWHRALFNLRTGKAVEGPACRALRTFPIQIEGGALHLGACAPDPSSEKGERVKNFN